jgi:hypothetical protein
MGEPLQKTLKEVAAFLKRPPHRIIHLCEVGLVRPTVDAAGRGSERRFGREDVFRILLALKLQEAGVQAPRICPLMCALDHLTKLCGTNHPGWGSPPYDIVELILRAGSKDKPVQAFLTPPDHVFLITPRLPAPHPPNPCLNLLTDDKEVPDNDVWVVVRMTGLAEHLSKNFFFV